MRRHAQRRDFLSFIISSVLHVGIVFVLALIPAKSKQSYEIVDLDVSAKERKPAPEPESEQEPDEVPEPEAPRAKKRPKPPPKPKSEDPPPLKPPEEKEPDEAPEAPPVFDLGDNTFATGNGQQGSWSLQRSEGNTKIAPLAKKKQPSVRGTRATGDEKGKPGGTGSGYAPVPLRDLSKRPKPKGGNISIPPYPLEARRQGIEGTVVLQVFIDKKGRVRRTRVIKDPGGGLGKLAQSAMLKEKWNPGIDKEGNSVDTVIVYSYLFVLDG
ncbi:MAG: TonB family protein [Proteobacteria bacterium]|nr:TonB family protein [Pseudomonadota bacterium]